MIQQERIRKEESERMVMKNDQKNDHREQHKKWDQEE